MELTETAPPELTPVPIRELAAHLRLAQGFNDDGSEDALLELYLRNATAAVERRTGQALIARPVVVRVAHWDRNGHLTLPVGPVAALDQVQMVTSAASVALAPGAWVLEPGPTRQRVTGPGGAALPAIPAGGVAEVVFTAGHGPGWNHVPDDLRQAVLLLATAFYENRDGAELAGDRLPGGIEALLAPHRAVRL